MKVVNRDMPISSSAGLISSRKKYDQYSGGSQIGAGDVGVPSFAMPKDSPFADSAELETKWGVTAAGESLLNKQAINDARLDKEAALEAAQKKQAAANGVGIVGGIAKVAATALPFVLCDERLKRDIRPLRECEVMDRLSALAFDVMEIRARS
jgi:hypothetical protein